MTNHSPVAQAFRRKRGLSNYSQAPWPCYRKARAEAYPPCFWGNRPYNANLIPRLTRVPRVCVVPSSCWLLKPACSGRRCIVARALLSHYALTPLLHRVPHLPHFAPLSSSRWRPSPRRLRATTTLPCDSV